MRIERIKLVNYCQHRNLEVNLTGNFIGIVGPNGSGKSNFSQAPKYAITGEFDRKKDRLITLGETTGSIEIDVRIAPDQVVTVTRALKGNKAELKFGGDRPAVTGADAVNEALLELIKVDKTALLNIVFVGQDELGALLYSRDSERERLAQQFFGIDRAVRIERILADRYNRIYDAPRPRHDLVELGARLAEKEREIQALDVQLAEINSQFSAERLDALIAEDTRAREFEIQNAEYVAAVARVQHLESEIQELTTRLGELKAEADGLSVEVIQARLAAEEAKQRAHEEWQRSAADLKAAEDALTLHLSAGAPCTQEFIDGLTAEIEAMERESTITSAKADMKADIIQALTVTGHTRVKECQICHSVVDVRKLENIQSSHADLIQKVERIKGLPELRLRKANWVASLRDYGQSLFALEQRVSDRQERHNGLQDPGPGYVSKWIENLDFVRVLCSDITVLEQTLASRTSELLGERQRVLRSNPNRQSEIHTNDTGYIQGGHADVLPTCGSSSRQRAEAIRVLSECRLHKSALEGERLLAEHTATTIRNDIADTIRLRAEADTAAAIRNKLGRLRQAFHPDGCPRQLVTRRVERMESKINEYLGLLGVNFVVRGVGGFDFEAVFPDKPGPLRITELSGGQKVDLSLAFRFAACESFSSSAGLLVMDEPSVYLDAETKQHMVTVFERLSRMAAQLGMQFLVVTHEESLLGCFDQIVDFGPAK